ncbi:conserved hypothetical protein [Methanococcus vannielii SB]|jgi:energy-converting hydrogenase A subunit B|uniref:Energy-converting hydrogenase A, subunit B n=1 Tax=Methanococcus vannielii (strain ATCC 35089 / DSM 1224 / JCM 13029 / OCM 148 / SB) TaxID=406327 RepID=A6UQ94_METVS|nr:hypothetical protein [Methanococcus vannielii]ABR54666.1 conserved hypothetical protein [Methanococcus vannielii SB]
MVIIEILKVIIAFLICFLNFIIVDTYFGLPKKPGVLGAKVIGQKIENIGGNLNGGYFMGNIVCSPDASAGTLMASIFYYLLGVEGGLIASLFIYIGNRLCNDTGYAGTIGTITATVLIYLLNGFILPEYFIAGMVVAIFVIQGLNHEFASKILGTVARKMGMI